MDEPLSDCADKKCLWRLTHLLRHILRLRPYSLACPQDDAKGGSGSAAGTSAPAAGGLSGLDKPLALAVHGPVDEATLPDAAALPPRPHALDLAPGLLSADDVDGLLQV